jgi:hypothetical protein
MGLFAFRVQGNPLRNLWIGFGFNRKRSVFIALGTAVLLLTGCSDFVDHDQAIVSPDLSVILEPGHRVGQTFVARHGGLSGMEFWLEAQPGSAGVLRLHLRSDPQSSIDLAVAKLSLDQIATPGFYRFSFPSDHRSHGVYRYAVLELDGVGAVRVGGAPGDAYIDGAAYRDHEPLDVQLAFRLVYNPWGMILELGRAALGGIGLLKVAAVLYLIPGCALLTWLWRGDPLPWPVRMTLAAGLSLALYPLLFLWTDLVGLHLGPLYAWGPVVLGLVALAWRYRRWRPRQGWEALRAWARSDALWPDLALVVILALVFGVRFLVVRTLDAPMWGDSYQHAVIAQLLVDNGGLFDSWEPYTPYRGLTVHFGFPAAVALISWMTGLEIPRATLLTGQLVNGLAVLTLYPLAVRLARGNRWAGVGVVLVAGIFSPMPAYYVNWGRFAQLAGQAVLPVALWLLWDSVDRERVTWGPLLLAGLTLGGMVLHYYRMPFYYATFVLAWLVGWGLPEWKADGRRWLGALNRMAQVAGVALLLVLPWGSYIAGGRLAGALEAGTSAPSISEWERVLADYRIWRDVAWYVPWPLLGAALLALTWALVRGRWAVAACALWVAGLASLVAGRLFRLPGANMMQNFAVLIALYIPVGLMTGWLIGEIARGLGRWGATAVLLALALWSVRGQVGVVDIRFALVTRPDIRAMAWIRDNVPADARFLVEGFRIYQGRSAVGADAGWWIPLLARRKSTMPPQYALLNEAPAEPDYSQRVVDLVAHLEEHSPASPEGLARLCEWGITHVYIGQRQGKVGAGATQLFSPEALADSSAFRSIYHQDRVWIFALKPEACEERGP